MHINAEMLAKNDLETMGNLQERFQTILTQNSLLLSSNNMSETGIWILQDCQIRVKVAIFMTSVNTFWSILYSIFPYMHLVSHQIILIKLFKWVIVIYDIYDKNLCKSALTTDAFRFNGGFLLETMRETQVLLNVKWRIWSRWIQVWAVFCLLLIYLIKILPTL